MQKDFVQNTLVIFSASSLPKTAPSSFRFFLMLCILKCSFAKDIKPYIKFSKSTFIDTLDTLSLTFWHWDILGIVSVLFYLHPMICDNINLFSSRSPMWSHLHQWWWTDPLSSQSWYGTRFDSIAKFDCGTWMGQLIDLDSAFDWLVIECGDTIIIWWLSHQPWWKLTPLNWCYSDHHADKELIAKIRNRAAKSAWISTKSYF